MEWLVVEGGRPLCGTVAVHGAKNAALPILSAALVGRKSLLHNCPLLSDISAAADILRCFGCEVTRTGDSLFIDAENARYCSPPEKLMREMRSSVLFLGATLARFKKARISLPGGCELGARPVDMHIDALRKMGAVIEEDHGFLNCFAEKGLHGAAVTLPFPSVGATENVMIAAACAKGETVIRNAAREPEIQDLADFLNGCGADIIVLGDEIHIFGGMTPKNCEHSVIPDRIEAATYLCAAAATGGNVTVSKIEPAHLAAMLPAFEEMDCELFVTRDSIKLKAPKRINAVKKITTMPYPGFPTDAQAPFMAALCSARGTGVIVENIFESRFKQAGELLRMGAKIDINGRIAVIEGVKKLHGATVYCTDLRGGAALVIAALAADGESRIYELRHLDRGYCDFEENLSRLGAEIKRIGEKDLEQKE
ncbi:MAG: UDP-N-acetylglucosamine 1-carboxyvinyltransferase [Oscillospiraceae bacterium]|nr:UDP-N-acetylglucosamine 1-carboxyvinyltransferase [Oscillospiraceae bacterium]MBP1556805.1 UDP-N-acetylglucosamine 1-carboxyvinyltransferase [Oscillospiraceae bacterium]